jgi:hypothetical protein
LVIETRNIPQEEAIENIKNVLHQQKGVYFSIMYPDFDNLDDFRDHWRNGAETDIYDIDYDCGTEWNSEEAVGHAMLIVGYNDEEGTENDYWIVLNSWGITDNRPNGILIWEMHMNYDCQYSNNYAFQAKTLDVLFEPDPNAPEKPMITGPTSGQAEREYTYEVSAEDPQGDEVYFYVKWDSGLTGRWIGPYPSGEKVQITHTWNEDGNYIIRARARDSNNNISVWSSYEVSMSKNKAIDTYTFIWESLIERFPLLQYLFKNNIQS